ncbi:uncharacterized protein LOC126749312 isoform X2 [Anthonomus grandis grandis]|uniref:uncharacterized protein LOC126749312 isoform X2 n=1 Tax=Anthonomus grandis grandis TaxID=2921223 RepID=UPI00216691DB|nr:uncharacterized protein LOC126749312 isoform X2 [Anthonomus grandis grandis]
MEINTNLSCHICQKHFSSAWNFRRHLKAQHSYNECIPTEVSLQVVPLNDKETNTHNNIQCHLCAKKFATGFSLRRHLKSQHVNIEEDKPTKKQSIKVSHESQGNEEKKNCSNKNKGHKVLGIVKTSVKHVEFIPKPDQIVEVLLQSNNQGRESGNKSQEYGCLQDKTSSATQKHMKKHQKKQRNNGKKRLNQLRCLEEMCHFNCTRLKSLRYHLELKHNILQEVEVLQFESIEEFKKWKNQEESKCVAVWVKACGIKKNRQGAPIYYYCNRTGKRKVLAAAKRKRALKGQGSCKINASCTSALIIKHISQGVKVTYFKNHYGHEKKMAYISLSINDKNKIAQQLIQGIPYTQILNNIRESVDETFERIHLTTKNDIHNIAQAYNLHDTSIKDPNDAISIAMWVDEMQKSEKNPVILYKKQGELDSGLSLKKEDFLLGIMTRCQGQMLQKFGSGGIICMDATHGTNPYDFNLITVLVVDDYGEGFPVGFLFANREDYVVLKYFILALKSSIGNIRATTFMSDDADQYFAAWSSVMDVSDTKKLLCIWHIDRAWRSKISLIKDKSKQIEVYKMLCFLRQEPNANNFKASLGSFIEMLQMDQDLKVFGEYFLVNYARRSSTWAMCFRAGLSINTNMYLESMHKVLKYIYLKGTTCRRLDKTVHVLLKYIRDKQFGRIIKLEKGKITHKISKINKSHIAAVKADNIHIISVEDGWKIQSGNNFYLVKLNELGDNQCNLKCSSCMSCVHSYTCNCMDYVIHNNMCKHIHKLCMSETCNNSPMKITHHDNTTNNNDELQSHLLSLKQCNSSETIKKIREDISFMSTFDWPSVDDAALRKISGLLTSVKHNMINSQESSALITESSKHKVCPANKKITTQPRFFSTKLKKKPMAPKLAKPSQEEITEICSRFKELQENK